MHVGVDIGGTKMLCRATTPGGVVVDQRRVPTGRDCSPVELDAAIADFVGSVPDVRAALLAVTEAYPHELDVAVVVSGTGIAAGFTTGDRVHGGADGWAGELG